MATTTSNLSLRKPEGTDFVSVSLDISGNFQTIDDKWASSAAADIGSAAAAGTALTVARTDHVHTVGSGTVSAPGLPVGESNTGLYRPGTGQLAATIAGTLGWTLKSAALKVETALSLLKATGATPDSGYSALYPKTDEKWYRKTSGGTEIGLVDPLQIATPSNPSSTYTLLYPKSDDYWYRLASSGSEAQILDQKTWLPQNPIINGGFRIAQTATTFTGPASGTYTLDRWRVQYAGAVVPNITQSSDVPAVAATVPYATYSLSVAAGTADTSIAAGDYCLIDQPIEGYNFEPFAQKQFTLGFWVKSSITGTYSVGFRNSGTDRAYVAEYTINSANTWEYKTITVSASPSAGTWDYTISIGLQVMFSLSAGSSQATSSLNTWNSNALWASTNQVNGTNTSFVFKLWGVTMQPGPVVAPFWPRPWAQELALCQRYLPQIGPGNLFTVFGVGAAQSTTQARITTFFQVAARKNPTGIAVNGGWRLAGGANIATSSIAFSIGTPLAGEVVVTVAAGLTAGDAEVLQANNDSTSYIQFTGCEL